MSDARKRALELARRRAKQRQNATAERDRKEQDKIQRDKDDKAGTDPQQSYLEKQRQREEKRKQEERDLLQREMEKLQRKQKVAKDSELKKKESKKRQQEEELTLLKEEQKKRKLAEQQKDDEILRLKKQAEEEKKLFERKLREQEHRSSALNSAGAPQTPNSLNSHTQNTKSVPKIKNISLTKITRNKRNSSKNDFELDQELVEPNTLLPNEKQIFSPVSLISTTDPIERQNREEKFFQSHVEIQETIINSNKINPSNKFLKLWNAQPPLKIHQAQKLELFDSKSEKETLFWNQLNSKSNLWLPFVSYHTFYSVLQALSAKLKISDPRKLKIFVDHSEEILSKALIDGIHWGLILPHFESDFSIEPQPKARNSLGKQIFSWQRWVPDLYHKIKSFSISEEFLNLSTPKTFQKFMIGQFLHHDIIRDFLHGISSRSQKYAIKSQMFEKSLLKLYPTESKDELNVRIQNIVDYAEEFGFISVSDPLRYKSGSSQYISITTFGHQKIKQFNKMRTTKPTFSIPKINPTWGYKSDYQCSKCGFDLKTDFDLCPQCGDVKTKKCRKCHQSISTDWDLCPYCGLSQTILFFP